MVAGNEGYHNVNNGFVPIYKDKLTEARVKFAHQHQQEPVNNNTLEVSIQPYQELTVFARRLIFILIILQTLILLSVNSFLYVRVLHLEEESARMSRAASEGEARISRLAAELELLKDDNRDLTLDCSLDININRTDGDDNDLDQLLLNVLLDDDDNDDDDDDEEDIEEIGRDKRHIKSPNSPNNRQTKRRKNGRGKINDNVNRRKSAKRRLVCHKCKASRERNAGKGNNSNRSRLVSSEMGAAHFKGGLPEILVKEKVLSGTIGPWFYDGKSSSENFRDFELDLENSSVLIQTDGFFFIYAQVYYLSSGGCNSFSIVRKRGDDARSPGDILATCSSGSGTSESSAEVQEVSCFTATVGELRKGDRLQLNEREMNRRVLFRDGQTYFGLMQIPRAVPFIHPTAAQPTPTISSVVLNAPSSVPH